MAFPTQDIILAWYAQYLAYTFKSHASVVNYLSGVKTLHVLLGFTLQGFSGILVKLTVRGIRRIKKHQPKQALAINPVILNHVVQGLNLGNPDNTTFWAVCLTSFFLLLRKSNVVPDTIKRLNVQELLCRQDISFCEKGALVTLRWSKTNQFGEHLTFLLPKIPGSLLCPVSALQNMMRLVPAKTGICFRKRSGLPWMYAQYQEKLHSCLNKAGYPGYLFSTHSMRQGGTTFAFLAGVPSELIKLLGL